MTKALHHYPDISKAPKWLVETGEKINSADAIVVVSAEYNHSIPPALSNMVDHFPLTYFGFKPSGIVCYSMGLYLLATFYIIHLDYSGSEAVWLPHAAYSTNHYLTVIKFKYHMNSWLSH